MPLPTFLNLIWVLTEFIITGQEHTEYEIH